MSRLHFLSLNRALRLAKAGDSLVWRDHGNGTNAQRQVVTAMIRLKIDGSTECAYLVRPSTNSMDRVILAHVHDVSKRPKPLKPWAKRKAQL